MPMQDMPRRRWRLRAEKLRLCAESCVRIMDPPARAGWQSLQSSAREIVPARHWGYGRSKPMTSFRGAARRRTPNDPAYDSEFADSVLGTSLMIEGKILRRVWTPDIE